MSGVPLERPADPLPQINRRLPPDPFSDLGRVEVLAIDLGVRFAGAPKVRLDVVRSQFADQVDHVAYRVGPAPPGVEGLARNPFILESPGERQIDVRGVLDVEEVALG